MGKRKKNQAPAAPTVTARQDALERFRPLLSGQEFELLLTELDRPLFHALRVNPLKADLQDLARWAERYGWDLEPVRFSPLGRYVRAARVSPGQTIEHRLGRFYIQDAASMLPVELFDLDGLGAPLVLDMAASPGGKTTHLTARTMDRGLVLANDSSASRVTALRLVLQNWGAVNAAVTNFPGESFGYWYPGLFDRVLLDAPCSMQGLRSTEAHPMRAITARERTSLAQRQTRLLISAVQALKVGGQVVYSTCTLEPEEDEGVLDAVMRQFPGCLQIEPSAARLPEPAPGLIDDGENSFLPEVALAARFWPHRYQTAGFFAALLTKTAETPGPSDLPPQRPWLRTGLEALPARAVGDLARWLENEFGFMLEAVLTGQQLSLWRRGREIFALPDPYLQHFGELPFQQLGLPFGEETPDGFIPAHDWVIRYARQFSGGRYVLPPEQVQPWLRGEDWRTAPLAGLRRGQMVLAVSPEGDVLGRGKISSDRLKNLLPRRLAI